MQGYIKLHRQLEEWEWYNNIPVKVLFLHCLIRANHKDNKWQGIMIHKGSFITSYENLAIETGLSVRQVRTALDKLKSTGELTHKTTSHYSIIAINNWDKFQSDDTQDDKQATNKRQTNDKQATTNNNDKNDKNDNNEKNIKEKFDLFWNLCPKQEDEYKTYGLFTSIIDEKTATADELLEGMKRYSEITARAGTEEQFIKKPCNWLRDRSWENEYEVKTNETKYCYNPNA